MSEAGPTSSFWKDSGQTESRLRPTPRGNRPLSAPRPPPPLFLFSWGWEAGQERDHWPCLALLESLLTRAPPDPWPPPEVPQGCAPDRQSPDSVWSGEGGRRQSLCFSDQNSPPTQASAQGVKVPSEKKAAGSGRVNESGKQWTGQEGADPWALAPDGAHRTFTETSATKTSRQSTSTPSVRPQGGSQGAER